MITESVLVQLKGMQGTGPQQKHPEKNISTCYIVLYMWWTHKPKSMLLFFFVFFPWTAELFSDLTECLSYGVWGTFFNFTLKFWIFQSLVSLSFNFHESLFSSATAAQFQEKRTFWTSISFHFYKTHSSEFNKRLNGQFTFGLGRRLLKASCLYIFS